MTIHDQIRNLEDRPSWAVIRPNYNTPRVARAFLDHEAFARTFFYTMLFAHDSPLMKLQKFICEAKALTELFG